MGSLEQRKRLALWVADGPQPWAGTAHPVSEAPVLMRGHRAVCGWQHGFVAEAKHLQQRRDDGHYLRQRPGRPCPGCPEHFVTLEPGADRSVSEDRTEAERAQGVEE